ncbi:MAG: multiheme c-type cytochrome [Pseudomonadota bacterium]
MSAAACVLLIGADPGPRAAGEATGAKAAAADAPVAQFLARHWARPLASQGLPPPQVEAHGIGLAPRTCAACHAPQFEDWRASLHSRAMGPGVLGQLADVPADARDEHQICLRCHAPLREQADSLAAALAGQAPAAAGAAAREPLHEQGLVCAACHVRGYTWYGPPRRDGSAPVGDLSRWPHNAWEASPAFSDSRFCAACHQFESDGYALNGKLLENTYEEWRASRHAREGRHCQACHMPDRRHLWRGIHDPDMVRQGVTIRAGAPVARAGRLESVLTVRNDGTGHHFPTYVTPRVVLEGYQEGAGGSVIPGTLRQHVIARQVLPDLSREIADTRIPPAGEARLRYRAPLASGAAALVLRVRVEPDAFYTAFYEAILRNGSADKGAPLIREALRRSRESAFTLFVERRPLPAVEPVRR